MIESIEALMPSSSMDTPIALLIISICSLVDILSPGVLAVTAYLLLTQPNQFSSHLLVFFVYYAVWLFSGGFITILWWRFIIERNRTII